jgi:hypothetical protein
MMKFNINNYATVTLTATGAEIYNKRYDDVKQFMPSDYVFRNTNVTEGFILKTQLWVLFNDFGEYINIGMMSPFKDGIIEFNDKAFS